MGVKGYILCVLILTSLSVAFSKEIFKDAKNNGNLEDLFGRLKKAIEAIKVEETVHEDISANKINKINDDFPLKKKNVNTKTINNDDFFNNLHKSIERKMEKNEEERISQRTMAKPDSCPSKARQQEIYDKVYTAPAPQSLIKHSDEFSEKQRIEVVEGVHFFIGYAMGNCIVIEAPEGLIVVDTLEGANTARDVVHDLREAGVTAPFKALIYTHNHPDHIGGSEAFMEANPEGTEVEVWAYKTLEDEFWGKFKYNRGLLLRRSMRMFGVQLHRPALINAGLGYELVTDENAGLITVRPNRALEGEEKKVTIAGLPVELVHIPGETRDQMGVYIPSIKAFCSGDDVYKTYPNLYSIRGTPPRPVENWMQSVDKILGYDVEMLLPSHTLPVLGRDTVRNVLTKYRDAIQYTFDQTIRLMNKGLHPDEVAQTIVLPPSLRLEPHLLEHYGTVEWSSKTIFEGQMGWFSGYPEELYPLTPKKKAGRWVDLVGASELLDAAQRALNLYTEEDVKWAVWLSTQVFYSSTSGIHKLSTDQVERARELRSKSLVQLASMQTSPNGRNYLLTWALEENCVVNSDWLMFSERDSISTIPIDLVLRKLSSLLIPEKVIGRYERVTLEIADSGTVYDMVLRNSILDVKLSNFNRNTYSEVDCSEYDVCVSISISEAELRRVINRDIDFVDTQAVVVPSSERADWFMTYFEDTNKRYY